jgi:hypothetical protein
VTSNYWIKMMKWPKRILLSIIMVGLSGSTILASDSGEHSAQGFPEGSLEQRSPGHEAIDVGHCTVIYASDEEMALGGGNEDWNDPASQVRFEPPEDGKYGIVYFGFANSTYEAGMNDQGLFFDAAATPPLEVVGSQHKISSGGYPVMEVMETCSTVEEALAVFDQYNITFMEDFQLMFGDSQGHSAILEGDEVIYKQGRYQIMTNFYQSQLPEGSLPGWRYRTAERMFERVPNLSLELFKLILDATHQEGSFPTQYSNIYDLKNRKVYVFYLHDYDRVVEIDLEKMLAQGYQVYDLATIFDTVFREVTPTPLMPTQTSEATPSGVSLEENGPGRGNFWMGLIPPLVVLVLLSGAYLWLRRGERALRREGSVMRKGRDEASASSE